MLWRDCTGSALKDENEVNLKVYTGFMMTVQKKENKTWCTVQDNSSLVPSHSYQATITHLAIDIHVGPGSAVIMLYISLLNHSKTQAFA